MISPLDSLPTDRRVLWLVAACLVLTGALVGVLVAPWMRPSAAPLLVDRPTASPGLRADALVGGQAVDVARVNAPLRAVSARARAAVVFVQVEPRDPARTWLRRFGGDPTGVVRVAIGSGVLISAEGYIVTNEHVVRDGGRVLVTLPDRRRFTAEVVGRDASTDLAVLKIPAAADLPILPFGDSDALEVGDAVLAVGSPHGLQSTVTSGIVSALRREVGLIKDPDSIEDFIQTDAAINPGNSGGPLVSLSGEVVGILTAIATESGANEGYGFAIPSNLALRIAEDLIARGEVTRGVLGVGLTAVTPRLAERLGLLRTEGVVLTEVPPSGAAYAAGLRRGDVVVRVEGHPVDAPNQLQSTVARYRPGTVVAVEVRRGAERVTIRVPLSILHRADVAASDGGADLGAPDSLMADLPLVVPEGWGLGLRDLTAYDRDLFGVTEGAYVSRVSEGAPAAFAGLPRDVVVIGIEGVPVATADEILARLDATPPGTPLLVRVRRRSGTTAFYEIDAPG